ncbi:MAG: general secretion pathway protein GspD [Gammaproteobacteria bacterium]|nr:general secretion pathway protein GspD [Gammaproteobacteria bacterium]
MINCKQLLLGLALICASTLTIAKEIIISELEFADANLTDVIRTLSELSDSNIIATPEATKSKVTIHLKNTTVLDSIKSISRISDLWYRHDQDTDTYRIMTREEYGKDLIVRDSEHIEVFKLLNANVQIIAQAIEDLYGDRVILSLGTAPGQQIASGTSGSSSSSRTGVRNSRSTNNNRTSNNRNNRSGTTGSSTLSNSGSQVDTQNLSIDQLEGLAMASDGRSINSQTLQQLTVQAQPIYVTVNNEHNMILVRTDDKKIIEAIAGLIKQMDIPIPQVMLEMKILSIILGEDFNSIFNFKIEQNDRSRPTDTKLGNNSLLNTGAFIFEYLNGRLRANIEFLEQNKRVKVLSNPMVLASNHREAELFIGEESLLTRGFTFNPATTNVNGGTISPAFVETETELQEIGITLRITPRINADETVTLELEQESSTINPGGATLPVSDGAGNVTNLPIDTVNTARLTGTVIAKNDLTVAVGGLIRTSKNIDKKKVPILGEIPVIGRVFSSTIESEEETETVLLITPHIMNNPADSEKIRKTDNPFYEKHNKGYPDLPESEPKFIKPIKTSPDNNEKKVKSIPAKPFVY